MEPFAQSNPYGLITDFPAKRYAYLQAAGREETAAEQARLLREHLAYAASSSPFYREQFREAGFDPGAVTRVEDIQSLPFTEKSDITGGNRFYAAPSERITDICLTSATTGTHPTVIPQTASDLARLAFNEELAFDMAGIKNTDTVLICAAVDKCFMAGLAYFLGLQKLGATAVRAGSSDAAHIWELSKVTGATAIVGVPSLMHRIGTFAVENGENPAESAVQKLIAIGEPTRDKDLNLLPVSGALEAMWSARIFSTYASTELATTFCECEHRQGGHLRPELNVIEIVDENGQPAADGTPGEVVTTPLGVTGMPLVRFRTNDISYIISEPCGCGRTTRRLAPVMGRKNQMLKYKGTTVFPNSIINALEGDPRFHTGYVEACRHPDGTDRLILYASLSDPSAGSGWIRETLRARVRVVPEINLISRQEADNRVYQFRKKRKRIIFFDKRE